MPAAAQQAVAPAPMAAVEAADQAAAEVATAALAAVRAPPDREAMAVPPLPVRSTMAGAVAAAKAARVRKPLHRQTVALVEAAVHQPSVARPLVMPVAAAEAARAARAAPVAPAFLHPVAMGAEVSAIPD